MSFTFNRNRAVFHLRTMAKINDEADRKRMLAVAAELESGADTSFIAHACAAFAGDTDLQGYIGGLVDDLMMAASDAGREPKCWDDLDAADTLSAILAGKLPMDYRDDWCKRPDRNLYVWANREDAGGVALRTVIEGFLDDDVRRQAGVSFTYELGMEVAFNGLEDPVWFRVVEIEGDAIGVVDAGDHLPAGMTAKTQWQHRCNPKQVRLPPLAA